MRNSHYIKAKTVWAVVHFAKFYGLDERAVGMHLSYNYGLGNRQCGYNTY